jgi:predicted ATPase/Tfp pilus assembly protein PilF
MSEPRALLQTDVVDSTGITERLGEAAASALWRAHDRMARDLLREWRGQEIDKSDGFLLLFAEAADAADYASAYHRELARLEPPLQARIGLHAGVLQSRANPAHDIERGAKPVEIDGIAKPIVARTMALAQPQQTLLTAAAAAALHGAGGPWRIASHGHWRLQGMAEPIEMFELGDAACTFTPPPDSSKAYRVVPQGGLWLPRREVRHSLPAERDAFVGREAALGLVARRYAEGARLISLLGIGGAGKTRLALRYGWSWLGDFPGGVWFCDLSQASGLDGIGYAVAQGLDVPLGGGDPIVQLGNAIAGRCDCLVILDNFEQVAHHAEASVGRWLERAARARFLVTTRELLGIVGEVSYALPPLEAQEGAALFMRRADAARPGFEARGADASAIGPLIELLDGLPLAIELAAARVRVMTPATLLARMGERFKLLVAPGGRIDRQATMRGALDWSWDLLGATEQSVLAQLAVFEGGFTLAAAEAVVVLDDAAAAPWAIDVVQALVEKSLVRAHAEPHESRRFDLLQSVQDYALERLQAANADAPRQRHWQYFARLDERAAVADRCVEADNLVAACRRSCAAGDGTHAVRALANAWAVLRLTGPFRVAVELCDALERMDGLSTSERGLLDWVAGTVLQLTGQNEAARVRFDSGLRRAEGAADRQLRCALLCALGESLGIAGERDAARRHLDDALEMADPRSALQLRVLNTLGTQLQRERHLDEAQARYESALTLARQLGDEHWEGGLLGNLGELHHVAGRLDEACTHYERALDVAWRIGDRQWAGNASCNLGLLLHEQGRSASARPHLDRALAVSRDLGYLRLEATVLCNLGIVTAALGELDEARALQVQAVAIARRLEDKALEGVFRGYLAVTCARVGRCEDARGCLAEAIGLLESANDRVGIALLTCQRAEVEHACGDGAAAGQAIERAQMLADELGAPEGSELRREIERTAALAAAPSAIPH